MGYLLLTLVALAVASILFYYALTGAPPVSARSDESADVVHLLSDSGLPAKPILYELGAGWGSMASRLARAFPTAKVIGIERSPIPFVVAWLRARQQANLEIRWGNFLRASLADADAVVAYLMIRPMPRLAAHLDGQLRPGTPVVTLTFWFRDRQPTQTRKGPGLRGDVALYRWPG